MSLRSIIHTGTKNRVLAFLSGLSVTALLQSSTATTLLLISFAKKKMIELPASIAVVLGADVSTTLVAQLLSFDIAPLIPALIVIGVIGQKFYDRQGGQLKHAANIFLGLALMLMALGLIREVSEPIKNSEALPVILGPLNNDFVLAILVAALLTWLIHSSLAAVLLFAALGTSGIISLELGILLVLGANLGGAIIPFAATFQDGPAARRITISNIIMRTTVLFLALPFLALIETGIERMPGDTARHIVHMHTGFNLALAILFLPLVNVMAHIAKKIYPPEKQKPAGPQPQYLDEKALDTPVIALAGAARETLRIAEVVEDMLVKTIKTFETGDQELIKQVRAADNKVDRIYDGIKNYMSRLSQESLDPKEADRYIQVLTFSTNLEHIGDIIEKSLMELATKKDRRKEAFSDAGFKEIQDFHNKVLENMRLAQAIFMSEDPKLAAQLVAKKQDIRLAADETSQKHFRRLSEGVPQTVATSSLHLDIIRDYRRINSYATRVAYAILENQKPAIGTQPAPEKTA